MKQFVHELVFGKNPLVSGIVALTVVASIALGCNCGKTFDLSNLTKDASNTSSETNTNTTSDSSSPSESETESLVKETTAAFADAVESGDFSELYANASSDFRNSYTLDEIKSAFKTYTDKKKIVLPVLRKVPASDAEFLIAPLVRKEQGLDILMARGKFPTKPYSVRYDYEYVKRDGEWQLLKLVINIP